MYGRKLCFFEKLAADVREHDDDDEMLSRAPNNPDGESAAARVRWALSLIRRQFDDTEILLADLLQAKDSVRAPSLPLPLSHYTTPLHFPNGTNQRIH